MTIQTEQGLKRSLQPRAPHSRPLPISDPLYQAPHSRLLPILNPPYQAPLYRTPYRAPNSRLPPPYHTPYTRPPIYYRSPVNLVGCAVLVASAFKAHKSKPTESWAIRVSGERLYELTIQSPCLHAISGPSRESCTLPSTVKTTIF